LLPFWIFINHVNYRKRGTSVAYIYSSIVIKNNNYLTSFLHTYYLPLTVSRHSVSWK